MKILLSILLILPLTLFSQETKNHKASKGKTTDTLEKEAVFPGGVQAMMKYLTENVEYPELSMELGDHGRVFIEFVVNKDGSIEQVKVIRGVSKEIDEEAMRVVRNMPNWTPAVFKGELARARCRIPINFILDENVELSVKNLEDIFSSNKKWYSSDMDSSYFKSDTIISLSYLKRGKMNPIKNVYVWSVLSKEKISFYNINVESGESSPMRKGYKYKIEQISGELFITFMKKKSIIDQFKVLEISQYSDGGRYKIQMKRETPYRKR